MSQPTITYRIPITSGQVIATDDDTLVYDDVTQTWVPQVPGGTSVTGKVDTFASLPSPSNRDGQAWIVADEVAMYVSDGTAWGDPIPMQGAATEAAVASAVQSTTVLNALTANGQKPVGRGEQGYTVTQAAAPTAADLATALTSAASFGAPAILKGAWSLSASVALPAGARLDARDAILTMTADYTPMFTAAAGPVHIVGGTFVGKATDYADAAGGSGDLRAPLLKTDNVTGVRLDGITARGFAGSALVATNCKDVHVTDCTVVGVGNGGGGGSHVFNPGVSKDNACIVLNGSNTGVWVTGCDLSYAAQGILGGVGNSRVTISGNHVHDIGGQHGVYLNNTSDVTISGNIFRNLAAQGVKLQISTAGSGDITGVVIADNVVTNAAGSAVLLTKSSVAGAAEKFRHVLISGIRSRDCQYGVDIDNADGVMILGVAHRGGFSGIRARDVQNVRVADLHTVFTQRPGFHLAGANTSHAAPTVGVALDGFTIVDPGQANLSASHFGIQVEGNVTELVVTNGTIRDANAMMRYGIFFAHTSLASTSLTNTVVRGARDYGYRGTAQAVRLFAGNDLQGALGAMTFPPSGGAGSIAQRGFGTAPPTTGAFVRGSYWENTNPAVQGAAGSNYTVKGWICTVGGVDTGATWVEDRSLTGT